jgi:hypothetical protein
MFMFIYETIFFFRDKGKRLNSSANSDDKPHEASWESPMAEFDEAITYVENSLERNPSKQTSNGTVIVAATEHVSIRSSRPTSIHSERPTSLHSVERHSSVKSDRPASVHSVERHSSVKSDRPASVHSAQRHSSVNSDRPTSIRRDSDEYIDAHYASVNSIQRDEEVKKPTGKLYNRISQYESQSQSSSLVRSSKTQELEGIQSNVVSSLVNTYEKSDNVLLGRQLTDPGQKPPNKSVPLSDTGEPLYAVPDRQKKHHSKVSDDGMGTIYEESEISPNVPPKHM